MCDVYPRGSEDLNAAELFQKRFWKVLNIIELFGLPKCICFNVSGIYCMFTELQSALKERNIGADNMPLF